MTEYLALLKASVGLAIALGLFAGTCLIVFRGLMELTGRLF